MNELNFSDIWRENLKAINCSEFSIDNDFQHVKNLSTVLNNSGRVFFVAVIVVKLHFNCLNEGR